MLRIVTINLIIFTCLLIGLELIFGTWFSSTHALHQFTKPRNIALERANPLGDVPPVVHYTRDANGFRGLTSDVSEIDLLTVGGSTTDQRYLDDTATFQAQLAKRFAEDGRDIIIANAGIDGQSTFGHIANFSSWFSHVKGLTPRYILFYVGINDALIVSSKPEYDAIEATGKLRRIQLFIREKSAFYQLYLIGKQAMRPAEESHQLSHDNFALPGSALTDRSTLSPDALDTHEMTQALQTLRDNIATLAALTREMNAIPIFVTQRSTAWTRQVGRVVGIQQISPGFLNRYTARFGPINGVDIHAIESRIAAAILDACHRADAVCFDLMQDVTFDLARDFYDEVHTNAEGAKRIASYLHDQLEVLDGF
ncbi:SGNH/GDSL hydrolase family protein [Pseudohalocynthiibacter aestuariivivens]|nr:SGNH/GDSL hydrolase family protein [Pseudohalocynthiibacter aestuariivivens]QIE44838.1 SGNH/GDSL hydrolase family protein [Pseudohalocynthiibacter aestuariivivens]